MRGVIKNDIPFVSKLGIIRGYIFIPTSVDRELFIRESLYKERFSVIIDPTGVLHNCEATKSAIRDIVFPKEGENLGSAVVLVGDSTGKATIVGVVNKQGEEQFSSDGVHIIKMGDDTYASIGVDKVGNVNIDILGSGENGNLKINANNQSLNNTVEINTTGRFVVNSNSDISLNSENGSVKINSISMDITSKKIVHNSGEEAMVLGNKLKDEIDKTNEVVFALLQAINNWLPVGAITDASSFKALLDANLQGKTLGDFGEILSRKSFLA